MDVPHDVQAIDVARTSSSVNEAPVVTSPSGFVVDGSGSRALQLDGLSARDAETPPERLVWTVLEPPAHGSLEQGGGATLSFTEEALAAGEIVYRPDAGDATSDTVTLRVEDEDGASADVTLAIAIERVNGAPVLSVGTLEAREGVPTPLDASHVSGADVESDPDDLLYTVLQRPPEGTLSVAGDPDATAFTHRQLVDGDVVYTHPYTGTARAYTMEIELADGEGGRDAGTLAVNVTEYNPDPPTGASDAIELIEGGVATRLVDGATSVLDNDGDPQGVNDTLSAIVHEAPSHGALTLESDGTFRYEHDGGESRDDRFAYTALDSDGQPSDPVEVDIAIEVRNVNTPPASAVLDRLEVEENHPGAPVGRLSAIDEDAGDSVGFAVDDVRFVVDGDALRLAPGVALDHESEPDVPLVVTATDAAGATSTAAFELAVLDLDDGPIARADAAAVAEGGAVDALANGETSVLANDGRGDGDARVELVDGPRHGTLELEPDGTFRYVHDGGENSVDTFVYAVSDASGQRSGDATVTLAVSSANDAPRELTLDGASVDENASGATIGRLDATDDDVGDVLRFSVDDPRFAVDGRDLRLADGRALDFETEPSVDVVVTATDLAGASRTETFTVAVLDRNDRPSAGSVEVPATVAPGEVYAVPSGTFVDPDGDRLSYRVERVDGEDWPAWLAFDAAVPSFTVLERGGDADDAAGDVERVTVRLHADDGRGGSAFVDLAFARPPSLPDPEPDLSPAVPALAPAIERSPAPTTGSPPSVAVTPPEIGLAEESRLAVAADGAEARADESDVELAERVQVEIETVDLASLIGERPDIGRLALADIDVGSGAGDGGATTRVVAPSIDTIDLASLFAESGETSASDFGDLTDALERERDALEKRATFAQTLVGGSVGLTSGLSVGYLVWLVRGGTLMGSVLSSLPAWRFVDPLPVLDGLAGAEDDPDDESLESLVDGDGGTASRPSSRSSEPDSPAEDAVSRATGQP